jgi:farnesyl-diphosphate farnesyltransferase
LAAGGNSRAGSGSNATARWISGTPSCDAFSVFARRQPHPDLLTTLLRDVSRSFYLTLQWLPGAVRPQIALAYLLARTTDTIADTELVPVEQRISTLDTFCRRVRNESTDPVHIGVLSSGQDSSPERRILERIEEAFALLRTFSAEDQQFIAEVLQTIISGQKLDLQRFGYASRDNVITLQTDAELEDYTYRVAGCVGEFWTRVCRAHLFPNLAATEGRLMADAVRFGKGLQLVNILRDLASDLKQGRCYLPGEKLRELGVKPLELLSPLSEAKLRPLFNCLVDRAEGYLGDGWNYTNSLPRSCVRVRLVCAWPILIGLKTLARLRRAHFLDLNCRSKVSRPEVRALVLRSILAYPWPRAWNRLYSDALGRPRAF